MWEAWGRDLVCNCVWQMWKSVVQIEEEERTLKGKTGSRRPGSLPFHETEKSL